MERITQPDWVGEAKRHIMEALGTYTAELSRLTEMRATIVDELLSLRTDLARIITSIDADIERFHGIKPEKPTRRRVVATRVREPLTPQAEFTLPLLESLIEAGGSLRVSEVIRRIGEKLGGQLTPADRQTIKSGPVRWQNRVEWQRLRLLREGYLANDSARGVWEITENGRGLYQDLKSTSAKKSEDNQEQ